MLVGTQLAASEVASDAETHQAVHDGLREGVFELAADVGDVGAGVGGDGAQMPVILRPIRDHVRHCATVQGQRQTTPLRNSPDGGWHNAHMQIVIYLVWSFQ